MEFSFGGLIPLWILGAPLIAGFVLMAAAPRHQRRSEPSRDPRVQQPLPHPQPATGPSGYRS